MAGVLRLRPCKKADGRYLIKWLEEERQMRMWSRERFSYPLTEEQTDAYYKELSEDEHSWGFTALDEFGIPVGSFKMSRADYVGESIHLGFIVIDPSHRGKGLGNKMVSMAVKYVVDILGMKRITLHVFENNPGARRCYEKVGFISESYRQDDFQFQDEVWGNFKMAYAAPKGTA